MRAHNFLCSLRKKREWMKVLRGVWCNPIKVTPLVCTAKYTAHSTCRCRSLHTVGCAAGGFQEMLRLTCVRNGMVALFCVSRLNLIMFKRKRDCALRSWIIDGIVLWFLYLCLSFVCDSQNLWTPLYIVSHVCLSCVGTNTLCKSIAFVPTIYQFRIDCRGVITDTCVFMNSSCCITIWK